MPLAQAAPEAQMAPHLPQFFASVWRSVQTLPHCVWPVGQTHLPLTQAMPVGQATPQPPQFFELVLVLTQTPLHSVWPFGQGLGAPRACGASPREPSSVEPRPHPSRCSAWRRERPRARSRESSSKSNGRCASDGG